MPPRKKPNKLEVPQLQDDEMPPFAIYARKSTDEKSEKQTSSIPQQIERCMEFAAQNNFTIAPRPSSLLIEEKTIDEIRQDNEAIPDRQAEILMFYKDHYIVTERKTAKEPSKRKKWREVVELIQKGKVRGLLSYSPDRISRNLVEGGELIQLVDQKLLRLRFTNFHFEENAAGHMMLGFWLVFAEHYSRKLSEDVTRGRSKKRKEGHTLGYNKYGYQQTDGKRFKQDPPHFSILRKAFERKLYDGWTDTKIAIEMNVAGWKQRLRSSAGSTEMTAKKISSCALWSDPFYYGVLEVGFNSNIVNGERHDLRKLVDYNFKPLLTEVEWYELQEKLQVSAATGLRRLQSKKSDALSIVRPLPTEMILFEDGSYFSHMLPGRNQRFEPKARKFGVTLDKVVESRQIRYNCQKHKVELRWSEIDERLNKFFASIRVKPEAYQAYLYEVQERTQEDYEKNRQEILRVGVMLNKEESKKQVFMEETRHGIGLTGDKKRSWNKEKSKHDKKIQRLKLNKELFEQHEDSQILEKQQFFEVLADLSKSWKRSNYVQKSEICQNFLLNITVNAQKRLKIRLKPELELVFIQDGGPSWT